MSRTATPADVIEGRARWCVVEGDALQVLTTLPDGCIDAVVTDPPYSSGGAFRGDRTNSTARKYTSAEHDDRPDFAGDTRDQRSWAFWVTLWVAEALRFTRDDARLVAFTDWRQLPALTDAVQAGGWVWRGIVPWDKGDSARPTPGGFKNQAEYMVWANKGSLPPPVVGVTILPGAFRYPIRRDERHHQTSKPVALMREVVRVVPAGAVVVDPFAGGGTTGAAALDEGRRVILCERIPEYAEVCRRRCEAADNPAMVRHNPKGVPVKLRERFSTNDPAALKAGLRHAGKPPQP